MIKSITDEKNVVLFSKLKKAAAMSDIHFGKKGNSEQHNQDCLDFIEWFCEQVRQDSDIDHVIFCGDWHEHRAALNLLTMSYSYQGAELLSKLGIPIFIIVGNHDLFHRHTRSVFSTLMFQDLPNIYLIPEPTVISMHNGEVLLAPYLFQEEYPSLAKYEKIPVWWGHFEFKGFVISGYNIKLPHGPDHNDFKGPKRIFSGHFHQRQIIDNIVYMGNTFPMDFSDSGDYHRGMVVYEYANDRLSFLDWGDCPKYIKAKLSTLLDESATIPSNARVRCVIDVPLNYEESLVVKQEYLTKYDLRELNLLETDELDDVLENTSAELAEIVEDTDTSVNSLDGLVIQMLNNIDTDQIDRDMLVYIYSKLKVEK
jgi:DNA repair exonuclease SbcCD nuclease subunit